MWQPLSLEFEFEQRQHPGRVQHLFPVEEKTLGLSFEITMKDCRGQLSIAVPAVVSTALVRKISSGRPHARAQLAAPDSIEGLRRKLLGCNFRMELELSLSTASARELTSLQPGKILALRRRADGIAELVVEGRPVFQARVARIGNHRAAHVLGSVRDQFPWKEYDDKPC